MGCLHRFERGRLLSWVVWFYGLACWSHAARHKPLERCLSLDPCVT